MDRVVLGTVQFGLIYGVANTRGQVTMEEGSAILSTAWHADVRMLDTAVRYGQSETVLGSLGVSDWQVITKLPEMPAGTASAGEWVKTEVSASLARLRVNRLHGLLLHRPAQLGGPGGEALYRALLSERELGRVRNIGVSVYGPEELDGLPAHMTFDIVQAPWNVLDQRMTRSGWAARLQDKGCEFHARSVFLQGLLLMASQERPARFASWHTLFEAWHHWLADSEVLPLEACLSQALMTPGIDRIVVGVDSADHLNQILAAVAQPRLLAPLPPSLFTEDPALLNPALWSNA